MRSFVIVLTLLAAGCGGTPDPAAQYREIQIPAHATADVRATLAGLNSPEPLTRARAAASLGVPPTDRFSSLSFLLTALQDGSPMVRQRAAEALGKVGDPAASDPLTDLLSSGREDREVRSAAAWALGELKASQAVEPLIGALTDTVWTVRYQAAIALGKIGDPAAAKALDWAARNDPDLSVRTAAGDALRKLSE